MLYKLGNDKLVKSFISSPNLDVPDSVPIIQVFPTTRKQEHGQEFFSAHTFCMYARLL